MKPWFGVVLQAHVGIAVADAAKSAWCSKPICVRSKGKGAGRAMLFVCLEEGLEDLFVDCDAKGSAVDSNSVSEATRL